MRSDYSQAWHELYGQAYFELITIPERQAHALTMKHLIEGKITKPSQCEIDDDCPYKKIREFYPDLTEPEAVIWICAYHRRQFIKALKDQSGRASCFLERSDCNARPKAIITVVIGRLLVSNYRNQANVDRNVVVRPARTGIAKPDSSARAAGLYVGAGTRGVLAVH